VLPRSRKSRQDWGYSFFSFR